MVSVVILSKNPPKKLFKDLDNQVFKDFEVIIASEKGIVSAMNNALKKAKGDIFVRIDDDVELPSYWLKELIKPFSDPTIAGVTGPTFIPPERRKYRDSICFVDKPHWFLMWLYDNEPYAPAKIYKCGSVSYGSNFMEKMNGFDPYKIDHLEGTNWAMRTELIRKVGGFDPKFDGVAEWFDTDVVYKIKKLGYKIQYKRKAYLFHMIEPLNGKDNRHEGFGRIKNWLIFHVRHSKFHPKMILFLLTWTGYFAWVRFRSLFRQ